ncbi:MAG: hypothetical protein RIB41_09935 [Oceanibaculum nanhaiense]|jgi:hypothetical protein|uniref:helix-turn-helix transcriptional regulator n=1 Tax=Oceanibaculum nanhaiense TaxID=1909734 RepID=UPI0032EFA527
MSDHPQQTAQAGQIPGPAPVQNPRLPAGLHPRLLSEEEAAAYCGLSLGNFRTRAGEVFPAPIRVGRRRLYDIHALDKAIDALSGLNQSERKGWDI